MFLVEELFIKGGIEDLLNRDIDVFIFIRFGLNYGKVVCFKLEMFKFLF